jgi:D-psicose/D-tagatose/L-ribulose 3-epimerase
MKLGLISSAWLGSSFSTVEGIQETGRIGFDTIDIFADPMETGVVERKAIREACRSAALPVISTVCVAMGIADFNGTVRRFHIDRARQYLEFGYDLEARNLLLVLGEYIWQCEVIKSGDQWAWAVESVCELARCAEALGQEIVLELEPFHLSLINDLTKMSKFLVDVGSPTLKANIDISHLALVHAPASEISKLKGRIGHVHLSDCDGKVHGDLPPGRGVVDFMPYLEELKASEFAGSVSIELEYSPEPDKIVDWIKEAYTETDRMMRELGIRDMASGAYHR